MIMIIVVLPCACVHACGYKCVAYVAYAYWQEVKIRVSREQVASMWRINLILMLNLVMAKVFGDHHRTSIGQFSWGHCLALFVTINCFCSL